LRSKQLQAVTQRKVIEQINNATGEAEAILARANARAQALQTISNQLQSEVKFNSKSISEIYFRFCI